jgi:hypothetical protein
MVDLTMAVFAQFGGKSNPLNLSAFVGGCD